MAANFRYALLIIFVIAPLALALFAWLAGEPTFEPAIRILTMLAAVAAVLLFKNRYVGQ